MVNKKLFLYGFLYISNIILHASQNNEKKKIVFDNENAQLKKLFHSNDKDNTNALIKYALLKKRHTKPIGIVMVSKKLSSWHRNINSEIIFSNEQAQLKAFGEINKEHHR